MANNNQDKIREILEKIFLIVRKTIFFIKLESTFFIRKKNNEIISHILIFILHLKLSSQTCSVVIVKQKNI